MTESTVSTAAPQRKNKLDIKRHQMPEQPVSERLANFREVQLGFDEETARAEASRCIFCAKHPACEVKGCPLNNHIRDWLKLTSEGKFREAALTAYTTNNMPDICGRICPQERLCEGACVVGIKHESVAIGSIERFLADYLEANGGLPIPELPLPSDKKVAVVGGGPAGIACAEELAKLGHAVTIFDAWPQLGGLLRYGIPGFKLEKTQVDKKALYLGKLGVEFRGEVRIGKDVSLQQLKEQGFAAIFIGVGSPIDADLRVEGADLAGVEAATAFLIRANTPVEQLPASWHQPVDIAGHEVVVLGGGDTAMDCVRTAVRSAAKRVTCLYRRDEANMPGAKKEKLMAKAEGVTFHFLAQPIRFLGENGRVTGVECVQCELGEPDASGRRSPVRIPKSNFVVKADTVILALGYNNNPEITEQFSGIKHDKWFRIEVEPLTGATSVPGVFAGGDVVNGADLAVTAIAAGRHAAKGIDAYLKGERLTAS